MEEVKEKTLLKFGIDGLPIRSHPGKEQDEEVLYRLGVKYERCVELEDILHKKFQEPQTPEQMATVLAVLANDFADVAKRASPMGLPYEKETIWASEHFDCPKKRYLSMMQMPPSDPDGINTYLTFGIGHTIGVLMANLFARCGLLVDAEKYFRLVFDGVLIPRSGRTDILIRDPTNNNKVVAVEVKSTKEKGFKTSIRGRGWTMVGREDVPKAEHVAQLFDYIAAENRKGDYETADYGYLVYVDKNNSEFAVHKVFWSDAFAQEVLEDDAYLEWHIENKTEPPRHSNGHIEFYKVAHGDSIAGDINFNGCNYPCAWKGGSCRFMSVCWKDVIEAKGNDRTITELRRRIGIDDEEGGEELAK